MAAKKETTGKAKAPTAKKTDAEKVAKFMEALEHPLKREIEAVCGIIKSTDNRIGERIKWNAPSYYFREDLVTFNLRATEHVHLVFHHPSIETIASPLLQGEYKGRRMTYFKNMEEVRNGEEELSRVVGKLIENVGANGC